MKNGQMSIAITRWGSENMANGSMFQAMWTEQYMYDIKGCPLGRANNQEQAINDLIRRTNYESGTDYTRQDVVVTCTHDYRTEQEKKDNPDPKPLTDVDLKITQAFDKFFDGLAVEGKTEEAPKAKPIYIPTYWRVRLPDGKQCFVKAYRETKGTFVGWRVNKWGEKVELKIKGGLQTNLIIFRKEDIVCEMIFNLKYAELERR